ncbi:MAG: type ISP restriction/modification enzyme [Nitrospinota bacterium]
MSKNPIGEYLKNIERSLKSGIATEHTYRSALESLLEKLGGNDIKAVNEPKRVKCGAPDYVVTRSEAPLGYIEAKDIDVSLSDTERSEQLKRYREALGNLILTNYLEFRWYTGGELRLAANLAAISGSGTIVKDKEGEKKFHELINAFFSAEPQEINNPRELADKMARLAQLIRNTIRAAFEDEDKSGQLHAQLAGFRKVLLHDLTNKQFADMYAQTISYGLFAARCSHTGPARFSRINAAHDLPKTNPFLRKMFDQIAGVGLDSRIVWAVEDLAELLNRADIGAILKDFGRRTRREDPVVHFYETFLAAYDPKMREARGVYYTPEPVVSYIVRSVDHILKTDFKLSKGLADSRKVKVKTGDGQSETEVHKVQLLDPAVGTGTFLYSVIDEIRETFKGNRGMWSGYVTEHLLPRIYGFELLMAPYAVAHMKLGLQLSESGYDFKTDERLQVYLTNTLEEAYELAGLSPFANWLGEEANAAGKVKRDTPIMVVLGNPPYSGHSANKGKWIADLLKGFDSMTQKPTGNYFEVDGKPLGERNPKWLNDDYVKFIRFAQWRIERTGYGVLAFISNHGYLDNPTFRGMRQSLMESFDDIYLLDLHGNAKKKEKCPDGSKDVNVFDIQQGVSIGIFVKRNGGGKEAAVRHADLWGLREIYEKEKKGGNLSGGKYHWLNENSIETTKWKKLKPQSPFYFFIPQDTKLLGEYEKGWKVTEAIPINGVGMTTARDHVVIDFKKDPILKRAKLFRDSKDSDAKLCRQLAIPMKKGWNINNARNLIGNEKDLKKHIKPVLYRPFDERFIFYHDSLVWRTVKQVMGHMLAGKNLGLIARRQMIGHLMSYFFASNRIIADGVIRSDNKGGESLFPLYLYPDVSKQKDWVDEQPSSAPGGRRPNLSMEFVNEFEYRLGIEFRSDGKGDLKKTFGPEDVFDYMYAVFHCPTYRSRYAEFLKTDFPRLPLTSNKKLFRKLCALGDELKKFHLMEKQGKPLAKFPVEGDSIVDKVRYTAPGDGAKKGRVWINKTQYFEGVPPEVWEFHIGGYQVCQKWLKDRKGRKLEYNDFEHYQNIVAALKETIRLMAEIDSAIDSNSGWPIR